MTRLQFEVSIPPTQLQLFLLLERALDWQAAQIPDPKSDSTPVNIRVWTEKNGKENTIFSTERTGPMSFELMARILYGAAVRGNKSVEEILREQETAS